MSPLIPLYYSGPKTNARRLFTMDNDPSQTSKAAKSALEDIQAQMQEISPRSPDLNPIENIFHLVKTVKTLVEESGLSLELVSTRTYSRCLNWLSYS